MTSYRSSIDIIALNCSVFEKIAFLHFGDRQTDKRTDRRTDGRTAPLHGAALAVVLLLIFDVIRYDLKRNAMNQVHI